MLGTLALGASAGRPLPETVLIPALPLPGTSGTPETHGPGPSRSLHPISFQALLPCLGLLCCSRQAPRGGHPAGRRRAAALHRGLAGSPSHGPGAGRTREAAQPQRPASCLLLALGTGRQAQASLGHQQAQHRAGSERDRKWPSGEWREKELETTT